jgi:cytochrome c-type biogenesis protein CcmE
MKLFRSALACVLAVIASLAYAHHSNTPFDMAQSFTATGVVEKMSFKNPHSSLTLRIVDGAATSSVTFEGHSLATLRHYGLSPAMVKEGDTLTISYAPRRDGEPGGIFLSVKTTDGVSLDFSHLGYE